MGTTTSIEDAKAILGHAGVYGTCDAQIDPKSGRVVVSTELKNLYEHPVVITQDPFERYLEVRRREDFYRYTVRIERLAATLDAESASALLVDYLGFSAQAQIDGQGRFVIPRKLRDIFGDETELILVGAGDVMLVWPKSRHEAGRNERREKLQGAFPAVSKAMFVGRGKLDGIEAGSSEAEA
jgi:MraZ protein